MKKFISHMEWQTLRILVRAAKMNPENKNPVVKGSELRPTMSRNSKNFMHLEKLEREGLIGKSLGMNGGTPEETFYGLTLAGKIAAEYGEYEYDMETGRAASPPR